MSAGGVGVDAADWLSAGEVAGAHLQQPAQQPLHCQRQRPPTRRAGRRGTGSAGTKAERRSNGEARVPFSNWLRRLCAASLACGAATCQSCLAAWASPRVRPRARPGREIADRPPPLAVQSPLHRVLRLLAPLVHRGRGLLPPLGCPLLGLLSRGGHILRRLAGCRASSSAAA